MNERDIITRIRCHLDQDEAFLRDNIESLIKLATVQPQTPEEADVLRRCATYAIRDLSIKSLEHFSE